MIEIKTSYTRWKDDFSEAKNRAKDMATGQWITFLDCADVFQQGILLRKYIVENDSVADYMFINTFAPSEDKVETHLRHARIVRNLPEAYFQKPIHEDLVLSLKAANLRMVSTDLSIVHGGYVKKDSTFAKNLRNYKIQKKYVVRNPKADSLDLYHLVNTYILLGSQFKKKKWWFRAIETVDRALAIPIKIEDPLWPKLVFLKARIYHELRDFEKAKRWYQHSIEKRNYIESYLGMGEILVTEQRYDVALKYLEKMLEIGVETGFEVTSVPKNLREMEEAMFYNLGLCYFHREEYRKAKGFFQQCLVLNRYHLPAVDLLCECLRKEGHYGFAFHIALEAVNRMPYYVNGYINLGVYEILNKRLATARIFFQEALRRDPHHEIAKKNLEMIEGKSGRVGKA